MDGLKKHSWEEKQNNGLKFLLTNHHSLSISNVGIGFQLSWYTQLRK
jgi:hypothetical protein